MTCGWTSKWALALGCLLGASAASAAAAQPTAAERLPAPVREWLHNEQRLLSREVDSFRIVPPTAHDDPRHSPDGGATFRVKSVWVDADTMHVFEATTLEPAMRDLFVRQVNGRTQVRLLVHPESERFYADVIARSEPGEDFLATATASSRTVVIWREGQEHAPFMVKLSLDRELGGVVRTVPASEVARSIGTANVLASEQGLPPGVNVMPEVLSMIPRGMARGGMIVRTFPRGVLNGQRRWVPLFSLYASPGANQPPMLARMIASSGMSAQELVASRIVRPFTQIWVKMAIEHGITSEAHAQNVLLEVGDDGLPTGEFLLRDFGGFDIDFPFRDAQGRARPANLPHIGTFEHDYHLDENVDRFRNFETFFVGGFLHNLDEQMPDWHARGWITGPAVARGTFSRMVARQVGTITGVPRARGWRGQVQGMTSLMRQARERLVAARQGNPRASVLTLRPVRREPRVRTARPVGSVTRAMAR